MRIYKSLVSRICPESGISLGEFLHQFTKLDYYLLEEAAEKGAVWLQRGKGKTLRERSLQKKLNVIDTVSFYYDPKVLALPAVTTSECLFEKNNYGIWFKPPGVVPQGTQAGDHASLLRHIEKLKKREIYLVHRLDRETAGLMVFAYTSEAAGKLGDLFQKNLIKKQYEALVAGEMVQGKKGVIDFPLDEKKAITHYEVIESRDGKSLLRIQIETGRLHQIRRHFEHVGHPVMGDPKYGRGNKNKEGLKLLAKSLSFIDPWDTKSVFWELHPGLTL